MKFLNFKILILVSIFCILIYPLKLYAIGIVRKFPSTLTGFCLTGSWQSPTDPDTIREFINLYGTSSAGVVKSWELEHSDLIVSGDYGSELNRRNFILSYIYIHTILNNDDSLTKWAYKNNKNYEDFSLHFKQDTIINSTIASVSDTFWRGLLNAGVTESTNHSGIPLFDVSIAGDAFKGIQKGGAFFIWAQLPFYEIRFELSRNGIDGSNLIIEYPSEIDENFNIIRWNPVTVISDETNVFSKSGKIRIIPPKDWKYAKLYPPYRFLQPYLVNGGGVFVLRIKASNFSTRPLISKINTVPVIEYLDGEPYVGVLHQGISQNAATNTIVLSTTATSTDNAYKDHLIKIISGTGAGQTRVITNYTGSSKTATVDRDWDIIPNSSSEYKIVRRVLLIRGWDPENDKNKDGFIDDNEYANLVNPNATARMRHYSRVVHANAWVSSSQWEVANVFNPDYRQAVSETIRDKWNRSNIKGAYIDDAMSNGLGHPWVNRQRAISPVILQGGYIWEYEKGRVDQDEPTGEDWFSAYLETIRKLKEITGSNWIGVNIANVNPFTGDRYALRLFDLIDWIIAEDTLKYSTIVDWWGGLALRPGWIYPAVSAYNKLSLIFAHHYNYRYYGINTKETWEYRTKHLLAYYYMINIPGKTAIKFWNHSHWYGSNNTDLFTFWKEGVPKNYAYQPTKMLKVDIGVPANNIPKGKRPMDLQWYPLSGYIMVKIGDTTSNQLILPNGKIISTTPTHIYILKQINPRNAVGQNGLLIPYDAVYAREYTKGLILMRLKYIYSGISDSVYENSSEIVELPGVYRVLNYDGTLGPPITQVSIKGGEGIILVKADQVAQIQPKISITIDKTNPKINQPTKLNIQIANREGISSLERILNLENRLITKGSIKINNTIFSDFISNLFQVISNILNLNILVILNLETIGR